MCVYQSSIGDFASPRKSPHISNLQYPIRYVLRSSFTLLIHHPRSLGHPSMPKSQSLLSHTTTDFSPKTQSQQPTPNSTLTIQPTLPSSQPKKNSCSQKSSRIPSPQHTSPANRQPRTQHQQKRCEPPSSNPFLPKRRLSALSGPVTRISCAHPHPTVRAHTNYCTPPQRRALGSHTAVARA